MLKFIPLICVVFGFLVAIFQSAWIATRKTGNPRMREITDLIQNGVDSFFKGEIIPIAITVLGVSAILTFLVSWKGAVLYFEGAVLSYLAVFFGSKIALSGNLKAAAAAISSGIKSSFKTAFRSGAVLGTLICVFCLLGLGASIVVFRLDTMVKMVACFGLGASTISFYKRVGGGIFNRSTEYASEMLSDDNIDISADDMRNPVVIADKIGDELGDVVGMGSDLFETYTGSIVAAIMLAAVAVNSSGVTSTFTLGTAAQFPLIIAGIGLIASILGISIVKYVSRGNHTSSMVSSSIIASVITAASSFYFSKELLQSYIYGVAITLGLLCAVLIGQVSSKNTETLPVVIVVITVLLSYYAVGTYGIALSAIGMLSVVTMSVSYQAFGPIANNSDVIVNISQLPDEVRSISSSLSDIGKTTVPVGKGFSIGAAMLTAMSLLISYASQSEIESISLLEPVILVSLLLGAMMPFTYSALLTRSVRKSSIKIYEIAKKQIRPAVINGESVPDYSACVRVATDKSIKGIVLPVVVAIAVPLIIGFLFGIQALGALIAGVLTAGALTAVTTRDISGTSINTLVKFVIFFSIVFSEIFVKFGGILI